MDRDEILRRLRERIVAFAASRMGREIAEDLAQEVLLVLEEKYPQVSRLEELVPLSLKIARFKLVAERRKSFRRGEPAAISVDDLPLPDAGENPLTALERKQLRERLLAALRRMEPRCRELFRLKLEGNTFAEIQEILGAKTLNTIYTWDFRCRKRLLELMGGSWEGSR